MKKNNKQSKTNVTNSCKNNVTDKSQNNKVSNSNSNQKSSQRTNKVTNSNNIGFDNESKSFELDDDDSHSFELR